MTVPIPKLDNVTKRAHMKVKLGYTMRGREKSKFNGLSLVDKEEETHT